MMAVKCVGTIEVTDRSFVSYGVEFFIQPLSNAEGWYQLFVKYHICENLSDKNKNKTFVVRAVEEGRPFNDAAKVIGLVDKGDKTFVIIAEHRT